MNKMMDGNVIILDEPMDRLALALNEPISGGRGMQWIETD